MIWGYPHFRKPPYIHGGYYPQIFVDFYPNYGENITHFRLNQSMFLQFWDETSHLHHVFPMVTSRYLYHRP